MKRRKVEDLIAERDRIGNIIDARLRDNMPVSTYTNDYELLTEEIDDLLKGATE